MDGGTADALGHIILRSVEGSCCNSMAKMHVMVMSFDRWCWFGDGEEFGRAVCNQEELSRAGSRNHGVEDGDQHQRRAKSYTSEDTEKRDSGLSWKMIKHIQKQSGNTCESMKILQFGVLQKSIWASVFWVLWTSLPLAWHWSHMDASMKKPHNCMRIISSYILFLHTLSVAEHNSYSKQRKPTSVIPHKAFR
jgi:hypothetical protein